MKVGDRFMVVNPDSGEDYSFGWTGRVIHVGAGLLYVQFDAEFDPVGAAAGRRYGVWRSEVAPLAPSENL